MLNNSLLVEVLENNNFSVDFMKNLKGSCSCNTCPYMENIIDSINELDNIDDIEDVEIIDDVEEIHVLEDDIYINIFDGCRDCINDCSLRYYIDYCDYHHELEASTEEFVEVGWNTYCYSSRGEAWNYCYNCEEPCDLEDLFYNEGDGEYYCNDCYCETCNDFVYSYHEWDGEYSPIGDSKEDVFLGFEIEVITHSNINECIDNFIQICDNNNFNWQKYFHIEEDGSLTNGIEFISQPLSFNIAYDVIPKMTRFLKYANFDIDSSCGGHIHITKNNFTKSRIVDVLQFMELNKDFIFDYSQRDVGKFNRWSPFYNTNLGDLENIALENKWGDRYHIINFNNYSTIEFRLFKGTLSFRNILANIELIKLLLFSDINKTNNKYKIREIIDNDLEEYQNLDIYISHYLNDTF